MNGYLLSVIGTVLICSFLTALAPEGKTSSVIKGVARLACVLAIVAPVFQFFKTGSIDVFSDKNGEKIFLDSVIRTDNEFIQYYSEKRIEETETALQAELTEKYEVKTEVRLSWSIYEEEFDGVYVAEYVRVDGICVTLLEQTNEEVKKEMLFYLTENYCSEVLIE